jgi:outer membrane protein OmpA-like peptidoglycan-associated protein/Tol biopolymer transport system component
MILRRLFFVLFILHASLSIGYGQRLSTQNKRAEKFFYSAVDAYQEKYFEKAVGEVKKALELDPSFTEAFILQGDIYADDRQYDKAIQSYQKAVNTNNPFSPGLYYILANTQLKIGLYADSKLNFQRFLESDGIPEPKKQQAERGIRACDFALERMANPVPFEPVTLGKSINTAYDEYINAITPDGSLLYFTRKNPRNAETIDQSQDFEEEFYVSARGDSSWLPAENLGPPINTHGNEGALNISPDGNYLFFAACNRDDGYGSCDIYRAKRIGTHWSVPENLGDVVNSTQWDSQPSFSSDGKTLYFASKRPGGKGSSDIWKSQLQPDGQWSTPENLGDSVNTRAEEMAPFIHPDNRTLYFSSKGHPGMGGSDLFYARKNVTGEWSQPVNLGYPINTFADEITLVVNASGTLAYISSDKLGGTGRQDIYQFPLYPDARPLSANYFKGIVYDSETNEKLDARFELIDLATALTSAQAYSDKITGDFLLVLPSEKNYALYVSRDGYLFYSDNFFLSGTNSQTSPFLKNIPLKPIRIGEAVILKNIFFDTDKYLLKDASLAELQKLLVLLQKNPRLKIAINGHTDNVGSVEHNLELSGNRAKAVYQYLVDHNIDAGRISYQGFGFSMPIDANTTEQGRANNRRTEFKVVGN